MTNPRVVASKSVLKSSDFILAHNKQIIKLLETRPRFGTRFSLSHKYYLHLTFHSVTHANVLLWQDFKNVTCLDNIRNRVQDVCNILPDSKKLSSKSIESFSLPNVLSRKSGRSRLSQKSSRIFT